MRIALVTSFYPPVVALAEEKMRGASSSDYRSAMSEYFRLRFAESDALGIALQAEGAVVEYMVINSSQLHLRWLRDKYGPLGSHLISEAMRFIEVMVSRKDGSIGRRLRKSLGELQSRVRTLSSESAGGIAIGRFHWPRMVFRQLREFKPDVVLLQDHFFFSGKDLRKLGKLSATVVLQCAVELPPDEHLRFFDALVTTNWRNARVAAGLGLPVHLTRHAFDLRNLEFLADERDLDVTIAWTHASPNGYESELIRHLGQAGLNFKYFSSGAVSDDDAPGAYGGPVWGIEYHRILARSKVVVNRHSNHASNANNLRMFEATGMGAALLTDDMPGVSDLFEIGNEVFTYSSPDELVGQIEFLLGHPASRVRSASQAQERTLTEHNYANRARELLSFLNGL